MKSAINRHISVCLFALIGWGVYVCLRSPDPQNEWITVYLTTGFRDDFVVLKTDDTPLFKGRVASSESSGYGKHFDAKGNGLHFNIHIRVELTEGGVVEQTWKVIAENGRFFQIVLHRDSSGKAHLVDFQTMKQPEFY